MINCKVLYPQIHVYENAIPNNEEILEFIKNWEGNDNSTIKPWIPWADFGIYRYIEREDNRREDDPSTKYVKMLDDVFLSLTEHYMNVNNITKRDNWIFQPGHICKYYDYNTLPKKFDEYGMAMVYHSDWQYEKRDRPGLKFEITCNFYFNDDYDGGGLSFSIGDDFIDYKPKAGDVIIFPSTPPYYHGVHLSKNGEKYFLRSFWRSEYLGSPTWNNNKEKYGEDRWDDIVKKKEKLEAPHGHKHSTYKGIRDN